MRALVGAFVVALFPVVGVAADPGHVVRDQDGSPRCVVTPVDGSASQMLWVDLKMPVAPSEFSGVVAADLVTSPARVVLLTPSALGTLAQRPAVSIAAGVQHPVIDGVPTAEDFVRASFPRTWVVAGTTLVAERRLSLPDGSRASAQSTCRITEADSSHWREP